MRLPCLSVCRYVCLHSTTLPLSTCLRVWDSLLLEGSKVLHRVALSLLRLCEAELRRQDNAGGGTGAA